VAKQNTETPEKKTIWTMLSSTNGKMGLIIAFVTGLQFLGPEVRSWIVGDEVTQVTNYVDQEVEKVRQECQLETGEWISYFLEEIYRIDHRYTQDSLDAEKINQWHAVGLRANKDGAMIYRDPFQAQYPVRANFEEKKYYYRDHEGDWVPCYFEKR